MEPLLKQLREFPSRFNALSPNVKRASMAGAVLLLAVAAVAAAVAGGGEGYQYVFTNLSSEDSAEAGAALKAASMPFRLEAGGAALAVPASKVYDARLLLATAGLPRGGGVGFELFDRGDLGVSEFTQKVNLRRAIEGELARTIGRLGEVRSARMHVTLAEKGLFRDDERKASAAVVVNLKPGRSLGERELAGIKHLVASAVPSLAPEAVTIVDGAGTVLSAEQSLTESAATYERKMARELEQRIVSLLEPAIGAGAVVARVSATADASEIDSQAEVFNPDGSALRSERKVLQAQSQENGAPKGVAGAAANQPLSQAGSEPQGSKGNSNLDDQTRNFEVSKTVTKTVTRAPRLSRLSVAVLVDGLDGKARPSADLVRLGELAKRAVGLDEGRGDQFEITSAVFARSTEEPAPASAKRFEVKTWHWAVAAGVLLLLVGALAAAFLRRSRSASLAQEGELVLKPGSTVAEIEAARSGIPVVQLPLPPPIPAGDPAVALRDRARELAAADPARAAHLLRAWMAADSADEPLGETV
jgi:flagellar M-ring protein FliF